jgi:hypothetical protein
MGFLLLLVTQQIFEQEVIGRWEIIDDFFPEPS